MERLTTATEPPSEEVWAAIREQSAERLLQAISTGTAADYGHLVSLYLWARAVLSPEQVQTAQAALVPTTNQVASWSVEQLRSVQPRMTQAALPAATVQALSVSWLEGRDLRTLENVDDLAWLWQQIHALGRSDDAPRSFSVTWTGSVQAPADGAYTFSICPLDLQYSFMGAQRTANMSIWIGSSRCSTRPHQGWTYRSEPVTLSAAASAELAGGAVGQSLPGEPAGPVSGGGPAAVGRPGPGPTAGALHGTSHARGQRDGAARPLCARDAERAAGRDACGPTSELHLVSQLGRDRLARSFAARAGSAVVRGGLVGRDARTL